MKPTYHKLPLAVGTQVQHLAQKGLVIADPVHAEQVLRRVGLYRFKGFLLPYKTPEGYVVGTAFGDIERLMALDDALRLHVLKAMQTVEVGIRQSIIQYMLEQHGVRWYADPMLFQEPNVYFKHTDFLASALKDFQGMSELFVGHYLTKYDSRAYPPVWMLAEILSLGTWSKLFNALEHQADKDGIAVQTQVRASTLASWLHALTVVRNVCAHQSRLYDRMFATMGIADDKRVRKQLLRASFDERDTGALRLAPRLYALHRLTFAFDPASSWTVELKALLHPVGAPELARLGFKPGWDRQLEWA